MSKDKPEDVMRDLEAITDAPEVGSTPYPSPGNEASVAEEAPAPSLIVEDPPQDPAPPAAVKEPEPDPVPEPVQTTQPPSAQPLPPELADRAAALQELTAKLHEEIESFKSGQSYIDGDVPVYLDALGGSGVGPSDRRVAWLDKRHLDTRYAYRWANTQMVDYHRSKGRWDVKKSDFDLMVQARGGKYSFRSNEQGQVICGDLVLMATTQENNEALKKRVRAKTARSDSAARGGLRKLGKSLGMEVTGEGDVGPKIQRIMSTIAKELGPDALKIFQ